MTNLLEGNQETASSYFNRGNLLKLSGKFEEAADAYRRCIELNPDFAWYHHNLGEVLAKLGQWEEARNCYRQACELNPNSAWSYHNLGEVIERQGHLEEAIAAYRRAGELNPESFESYFRLGETLYNWTQFKLNSLCSNPNAGAVLLQERQSKNSAIEVHLLNDDAFIQATDHFNDAGFVQELYRAYLRREASERELKGYSQTLTEGGLNRLSCVRIFRASKEFTSLLTKYENREEGNRVSLATARNQI